MPPVAYLGFTAETGELSDNHDIITVRTQNLYQHNSGSNAAAQQAGKAKDTVKVKVRGEGGGWGWFFMKFLLFGLVITGGYVGFTVYRTKQRHSRF